MKAWIAVLAAAFLFASLPAQADNRHYSVRHHHHSALSIGLGYGYPYYYGSYRHFYPSSFYGFGVNVGPRYRSRRVRTEQRTVQTQKLYVYPAGGQSEAQLAEDRYQCHVWSTDNTGFDPTLGAGSERDASDYSRAFTACMEGRDYVVK
jgi:hypothetical protein